MSEGEQQPAVVWETIKKRFFKKKTTVVLAVLVVVLAFFAFHNGIWTREHHGIAVNDVFVLGTFSLGNETLILPVRSADARVNSDSILIKTIGRTMNASGSLALEQFTGKVRWTGQQLLLKGTMRRAQSSTMDITWEKPETVLITMTNGLVDILAMNLSSLDRDATGPLTLDNRWTAKLNQTSFVMNSFEGRMYVQHVGEETTLGMSGHAAAMKLETENIFHVIN